MLAKKFSVLTKVSRDLSTENEIVRFIHSKSNTKLRTRVRNNFDLHGRPTKLGNNAKLSKLLNLRD